MPQKMFLKLDSVRGESTNPRHFGEIEIFGFTWGSKYMGTPGGAHGPGKAQINDLTIFKQPDKTSPILAIACAAGQSFPQGTLTVEKVSESGSLLHSVRFKLESILIDSMSTNETEERVELNVESKEVM
jgi:type VI secretion system secreted protein Hcp